MNELIKTKRESDPEVFTKLESRGFSTLQPAKIQRTISDCNFPMKAHRMIETCDPDIAQWSDDGKSFIIKDPDRLASNVIPQFFKHNKFLSFVRQLHIYGFRKIKADSLDINVGVEKVEYKHWCFRHEKFIRDRSDLLQQICKSHQNVPPEQQEAKALKNEVDTLKTRVSTLTCEVETLKKIVSELMGKLEEKKTEKEEPHGMHTKRKRHEISPDASASSAISTSMFLPELSPETSNLSLPLATNLTAISNDSFTEGHTDMDEKFEIDLSELGPIRPDSFFDSIGSSNPVKAADHNFSQQGMEDLSGSQEAIPSYSVSPSFASCTNTALEPVKLKSNFLRPDHMKRFYDSIAPLSKEVQSLFTSEDLFENISDPKCFLKQLNEISSLAEKTVGTLQNSVVRNSTPSAMSSFSRVA